MGKEQKPGKGSKNSNKIMILFSIIVLTVLLMVELNIMINDSQNYIYMVIVEVIMLILVYLLVTSILRQNEKRQQKLEEQYENIFKSEKASYILLRKNFMEIEERLNKIEKSTSLPKDEIASIQKAIAKIIISRSKENTDALLNSNDMMMEKLNNFENLLEASNNRLLERQKEMLAESNERIAAQQQEIEKALRDTIEGTKGIVGKGVSDIPAEEPEITSVEEEQAEPEVMEEPEIMPMEEEQAELEIMEEPEISDPNKMMGPDDIAALLASMGSDDAAPATAPEPESEPIEEPIVEPEIIPEAEPAPMSALEALAKRQPKEEPEVEPEAVENPEVEAESISESAIDMSDPNKMMGPDDIAALLASMGGDSDSTVEESDSEPIPEPEAVENPEPAQDLDPNRKMSPEEIEALFANL